MQTKTFIPAEYIDQVIDMGKDVFHPEDELVFLKSCLFYLKEGFDAAQSIELAMVDYLVDM